MWGHCSFSTSSLLYIGIFALLIDLETLFIFAEDLKNEIKVLSIVDVREKEVEGFSEIEQKAIGHCGSPK